MSGISMATMRQFNAHLSKPLSSLNISLECRSVFLMAFVVRILFLLIGLWHDAMHNVKYTDIDYEIVTDGARYMSLGQSPYNRTTFRYTPLLAFIMIPNILFLEFGKILFIAADMMIGYLLVRILEYLLDRQPPSEKLTSNDDQFKNRIIPYACFWLFNPTSIRLCTRGSPESITCMLVLLTLYIVIVRRQIILGGICHGLAIHFKMYPIIYSLALFLFIDSKKVDWSIENKRYSCRRWMNVFFNYKRLGFAISTILTLFALTSLFYWLYGWTFIYETYLYHVLRKDIKHNLSIHFYRNYLLVADLSVKNLTAQVSNPNVPSNFSIFQFLSSDILYYYLVDFGPQIIMLLTISIYYHPDITLCVTLLSMGFVILNKVCTLQFYAWYLSLLPLILPWTRMTLKYYIFLSLLWLGALVLWLHFGYQLEFLGEDKFLALWLAGIFFFITNITFMVNVIWFQNSKI